MFSGDDHPVASRDGLTIGYSFDDTEGLIAREVIIHLLLPVDGYGSWGMACLRSCISISGPSIRGNGWWGQVLNVEDAYLAKSYAFILLLFSGVQGKGNSDGGWVLLLFEDMNICRLTCR